ncbi:Spermidine N1-acetyltransferase (EC 2.3.1.57) [Caballeronia glathei]|nr:Spermidine N1-acetyltransferase (EC 2.3.1.57) [Caballeronia glathei]
MLAESDLRDTLAWRNRDGVRQQFKSPAPLEWESHHNWFLRYCEKSDDLVFVVEHVATGGKVGQVAIYSIDNVKRTAEIGRFVVSPEYQGQGLMRQGIEALMRFASSELALRSVYLEAIETNARARALYEALGFVQQEAVEGLIRMERSLNDHV